MPVENFISLSTLTGQIKAVLNNSFYNKTFWVLADVVDHKYYSQKNYHYFNLVEKDKQNHSVLAKIQSVAWGNGALSTTEAWCGLGISKFGLIMEDVTIDEVFYCFDKAKGIDQTKARELEIVVIETSIDVIQNLYDVVLLTHDSIEKAEIEKTKAAIATLAGTVMTANNSRNGRVFGSIASAGLTALSYTGYVKAGATIAEMKALHDNVLIYIKHIETLLQQFVSQEVELLGKFTKILNSKHVHVEVNVPMGKEIEKMKNKASWYSWGFWLGVFFTFGMITNCFERDKGGDIVDVILLALFCVFCWMKKKKLKSEIADKETLLERSRLQVASGL